MKSMTGYGQLSNARADSVAAHSSQRAPIGLTSEPSAGAAQPSSSAAGSGVATELDIAIRSVNGRYLEIRFHLPREYASFENEMKAQITRTFTRGTLDVYINRARSTAPSQIEVKVNAELARRWVAGYRQLGRELDLPSDPKLDQVARVPEVLEVEQKPNVTEAEKAEVLNLLSQVIRSADGEREREGQALSLELNSLCDKLETLSEQVETFKAEANGELEKRFRDRLQKLGFEGKVDDQRLAQEIVMQIDRSDVSEEITRLREHLKAYRQLLQSAEPQGKKLDFYAQELLREVNTIGSKSHIAKLTGLVVEAKTLVEKIREQVQNVE